MIPINQMRRTGNRLLTERYIIQRTNYTPNSYGEHSGSAYMTQGTVDGRLDRLDNRSETVRLFHDTMGDKVLYSVTLPNGTDLREGDRLVAVAGSAIFQVVAVSPDQDNAVFTRGYVKRYS